MKRVDLFCYKHPRFGVDNLMMIICIANIAVWLFSAMDTTGQLRGLLAFSAHDVLHGQVWRLVTFVFVPEYTSPLSLLISLYFYYFIGSTLERQWGPGRFTIYYLCGMLLQVLYGLIIYLATGISYRMTANYINLSMFFAFATLFPDNTVLLFFILPIKMKWLAVVDALFFAYSIFASLGSGMGLMSFLPLVAILTTSSSAATGSSAACCPAGAGSAGPPWTSSARCARCSTSSAPGTTPANARSAAGQTPITPIWSSATAPSARAITASVRIT